MIHKKRVEVFNFFARRDGIIKGAGESFLIFLAFVFLSVVISKFMIAATLSCSMMNANNCVSPNISVFRLLNDTGGYFNAHVQNLTLSGYSPIYNYSMCCSSDYTLDRSCAEATVLKFSNFTNAHVQFGNYTGPNETYTYSSCLSSDPGAVTCTYSSGSCAGGYSCVASMASSEAWAANQTNAHVGPCSEYNMKICCKINSPPTIANVILNSSFATNYTYENLTVYFNESDADGDPYTNITDWRNNGTSIAVLNMPFNTNTTSTSTGEIRDYSTFGNNGTLGGGNSTMAPVWNVSGKVGGAYTFDGINDYIQVGNDSSLSLGNQFTVSSWVYLSSYPGASVYPGILNKNGESGYNLRINNNGEGNRVAFFFRNDTTAEPRVQTTSAPPLNQWFHITVTYNSTGGNSNLKIYYNGVLNSTVNRSGSPLANAVNLTIGRRNSGEYFNGSIDDVQIFNTTLSANQIKAMYDSGIANRSVQMMHADDTIKGDVWTVAITGNDRVDDGTTVTSNNVTIRGSVPNVTLLSPPNGNETRLRTPLFEWNATDSDGDGMSYQINITEVLISGQFVCDDDILAYSGVMNFTPSSDLKCFYDNNYYYLWSVRANDSDGFSEWAGPWRLNMSAVVDMSMPVDFISFGQLSLLQDDNTTDNSPAPFQLQNDGNALINVNVTSTDLWSSTLNPSIYYRFKINNNTAELGSFNWTSSATSWTNFPANATKNVSGISALKYQNAFDSAVIDVLVQVPSAEPPGNKTATVTFMSILGE